MATDYIEEDNKNVLKYSEEEQAAWNEIKKKMNVPMVWFNYMPEQMHFSDYNISEETSEILLVYFYGEKALNVQILTGNKGISNYVQSNVELKLRKKIKNDQEITIDIWDTTTKGVESYVASLEYQECTFIINGALPFEEFEKIIRFIEII